MSFDILIVFAIFIVGIVLFTTERVSFDITALIILCTLVLTGILTPLEGLSGFGNEATVTIGAMFVLSEGVRQTGALDLAGDYLSRLGQRHYWLALVLMMLVIGVISAFINNTAAVAIFIPVVLGVGSKLDVSPSKLLMPLSFASMFGGVCTLIGTSTNILVSSIAEQHGQPAFSMFEFTPLGLVFFFTGVIYLASVGIPLIPERQTEREATARYNMSRYLTDVVLRPGFQYFDKSIDTSNLTKNLDVDVVQVFRRSGDLSVEGAKAVLRPGDVLRIRGNPQEIRKLLTRPGVVLRPARVLHDVDLERDTDVLLEAVIAPDSDLVGQEIRTVNFSERLGAVLLAVRHQGELQQDEMQSLRLSGGDSILLRIRRDRVVEVSRDPSFVVVSEVGLPEYRPGKTAIAAAILVGVVVVAALNLAPIVVTALIGSILMVLTGCLTVEEAHDAISWKIILLLAGVLPLGVAMEKSGAAALLSDYVITFGYDWGPMAVLSAFFFLTMMLTNIISNQATAVLLAPIAIQAAETLGVDSRPFLMAVTFAASLSFMTPVGYQTNTLIYGPGQYKFTDFTRVGTPLNILFWIIATLLIPRIWPF